MTDYGERAGFKPDIHHISDAERGDVSDLISDAGIKAFYRQQRPGLDEVPSGLELDPDEVERLRRLYKAAGTTGELVIDDQAKYKPVPVWHKEEDGVMPVPEVKPQLVSDMGDATSYAEDLEEEQ